MQLWSRSTTVTPSSDPRPRRVSTDIPDNVSVLADGLVGRVFANLLRNAVEHNGRAEPHVSVSVSCTAETVSVCIADNGPGVPPAEQDDLFTHNVGIEDNHGIGLTIVGRLVDRYDGSVELADTGPEGSVFVVELQRAQAASPDASPAGESG